VSAMRFSHLGVAVPDVGKALPSFREVFGYRVLSGPVDDPVNKVSVCFLGTDEPGEPVVELVAPLGEDSPVGRILSAGGGAYHMCYEVDDVEQTLAEVRSKGCVIISRPVPAVALEGRRIAWFYTPARQVVEIVER